MYHKILLTLSAIIASAPALAAPDPAPLRAIVNVDVMPTHHAIGEQILAKYVDRARRDPAVMSISLIQQSGSDNHFILDETFASKAVYDHYIEQEDVRVFRATLYPHLGSPWDEHLGADIAQ
jgi:quinol monooxygenase YgiN